MNPLSSNTLVAQSVALDHVKDHRWIVGFLDRDHFSWNYFISLFKLIRNVILSDLACGNMAA